MTHPAEPLATSRRGVSAHLGALMLVLATATWAFSFVVIRQIIPEIPAAPMNLARFAMAAVVLSPFLRLDRRLWRSSAEMSLWLFAGFATSTISLRYTTVNRSAFITAMNVIFVPILAALFGQRIRPLIWAAAITALVGCGLLCGDGAKPNIGDLWALGTAITWGTYIWRMEKVAGTFPPLAVSATQMIIVAILSAIWTVAAHPPIIHFHWIALIFLGLAATAGTMVLQATAQRVVPAPQAAVIFTLEPVFATIFSFLVIGEQLTLRGIIGAALIILAAISTQIQTDRTKS